MPHPSHKTLKRSKEKQRSRIMMKPTEDPTTEDCDPTMTDPESLEDSKQEPSAAPSQTRRQTRRNLRTLGLVILGYVSVAALVVGSVAIANSNDNDASSTSANKGKSTSSAASNVGPDGFGEVSEGGVYSGFDADLCRAVTAAVFLTDAEDPPKNVDDFVHFEFIGSSHTGHWLEPLAEKKYDMLAAITTHTAERDIHHEESGAGFSFSVPYFYDGLRFGGVEEYVNCADNLDTSNRNCAGLKICAHRGTTILDFLLKSFPENNVVELSGGAKVLTDGLENGDCNVIAGDVVVASHLDTSKYHMGSSQHTREPLAIVTRDDDARFLALFTADEQGITSKMAHDRFVDIPHFGIAFEGMLAAAVTAVGNYDEMYQRNLGSIIPRGGLNVINAGTSGLIFSTPFGSLDVMGPGPVPGGTLDKIKKRGHLNCGITRRAGFGVFNTEKLKWEGFDVDYCKALSAAISDGACTPRGVSCPHPPPRGVPSHGKVDVLSRITTYSFERDVQEPTSMTGFSFSQPVFYDGLSFGGLQGFAECADALDTTTGICVDLKICVNDGTTTVSRTRELFPEDNIVVKPTGEEALAGLVSGECNAVAGGSHDLARASVESVGYTGDYAIGVNRFSKDPLALVTNQDDPEWTDFVYWVVTSTFFAEEQGITKDLAGSKMPTTNLFGPLFTFSQECLSMQCKQWATMVKSIQETLNCWYQGAV
ncbi:Putative amino-acid ABC transporter-binding protein YhdW [Seminavis robusta]|uniref:Amino-acid ABC transporter-binding protein YhdW n=1 Tax=Seminavis robusta TaxID=568900 RepID=A0A9N8F3I2_9STRA|nr:Putative amino-acid ABC transporter-binding protein YhdW [Seminavis robusta]|eukprot:Sro3122_g344230.1 Putative amino-acid ABC transporter-binding protein YhdW (707) ;mRNA; f:5326-7688